MQGEVQRDKRAIQIEIPLGEDNEYDAVKLFPHEGDVRAWIRGEGKGHRRGGEGTNRFA